jgi:hypothetical protein
VCDVPPGNDKSTAELPVGWCKNPCEASYERQAVVQNIDLVESDRLHVDLSNDAVVRHWTRTLGCSKEEIEAAIAKVGNNPETVAKQLGRRGSGVA